MSHHTDVELEKIEELATRSFSKAFFTSIRHSAKEPQDSEETLRPKLLPASSFVRRAGLRSVELLSATLPEDEKEAWKYAPVRV